MELKKLNVSLAMVAVLITGCSESQRLNRTELASTESSAEEQSSSETPRFQALAEATGTLLARENESFTVAAGSTVSYGAGSSFVQKSVSGSATCSNAFFGSDPIFGVVKACYLVGSSPAPTTSPNAPTSPSGTPIARENETFTVAAGSTVSYGAGSSFVQKPVSGSATCSNAFFGSDPIPGVVKACYVVSSGPAPSGTPVADNRIATENENFSVAAGTLVSYGAGSSFVQATVNGSATCSNAFFGSDPIPGVVKACYVTGSVVVTPAPAPPVMEPVPSTGPGTQAQGTRYLGRWDFTKPSAPNSVHSAAGVSYRFQGTSITADLNSGFTTNYLVVEVDGVRTKRLAVGYGLNSSVVLASGLSNGVHTVTVIREGEMRFGGVAFSNVKLSSGGSWQAFPTATAKVVEVIGDSNSSGTCLLGNQFGFVDNAENASAVMAWPYLLQTNLAARGINIESVNLAMWGSDANGEASAYRYADPWNTSAPFSGMYQDGRRVDIAILFGGANDAGDGGMLASGSPVSSGNLSAWQAGVYSQMKSIWAYNPNALIVQAQYSDVSWTAGYAQINSLFTAQQRSQIYQHTFNDLGAWSYCGHPDPTKQRGWADSITSLFISKGLAN